MSAFEKTDFDPTSGREPAFQIDGRVVEVLQGCGVATVCCQDAIEAFSVNKGTDGVHFEALKVGQKISCDVGVRNHRVLHVHQQTQPIPKSVLREISRL